MNIGFQKKGVIETHMHVFQIFQFILYFQLQKKTNLISFSVCISRSEMDGDNLKFLSYMNDLVELFNLGIKLCLFQVICRSCGIDYLTPPKRQDFLMMVLPGNYKFASMPLVSVHLLNHLKKKFFLAIGLLRS